MHWLESWLIAPRSVLSGDAGKELDLSVAEIAILPRVKDICPICAEPSFGAEVCGACLAKPPAFDVTQVAFYFRPPLTDLIHDLKYHRQIANARLLSELYLHEVEQRLLEDKIEAIVAVPVHPLRRRERGYNQASLLAQHLARHLQIPLVSDALQRVKNTPSQTQLDIEQRHKNLRQAFDIDTKVLLGIKRLAIVDDVMTTGATMQALAQALRKHTDIEFISCWIIAKTE